MTKKVWIPQAIVIPMLLWALYPENPYGYYILLKWVCCAAFVYLAIRALKIKKQGWSWILGITGGMYNPFLKAHFTREIWSVVNLVTIGLAIAAIFVLKSKETKPPGNEPFDAI